MSDPSFSHEFDSLNFSVERSIRYNNRRRDHYSNIDTMFKLGIILFGSASFLNIVASYIPNHDLLLLIVVFLGATDLVMGFANQSTAHAVLSRRFTDLASTMRTSNKPTLRQIREWADQKTQIDMDEPAPYCALEAFCDNEVSIAWGWHKENGLVPITWWQRQMMNWIKFEKYRFPERKIEITQS